MDSSPAALLSDPAQQQAVYERMQSMLSDLQQQYAEKLAELVRDAQGQAEAIVRNVGDELPDASRAQVPTSPTSQRAPPGLSADAVATAGCGRSQVAAEAADIALEALGSEAEASSIAVKESHGKLAVEEALLAEGEASSGGGSDIEDERDGDIGCIDGPGDARGSAIAMGGSSSAGHAAKEDIFSPSKQPKACLAVPGKKVGKKKKGKLLEGIQCIKTINFEGKSVQPVRCAITVQDEVWTADWSGRLHVRDRDNVDKIKTDLPSQAIVWCMAFVPGKLPLVWIGQERAGIPVFHAGTKQLLCTLTGGHSGNVLAFTVANGPNGRIDIYSAGNDFAIRCWHLEQGTGKSNEAMPLPGKTQMQIRRGNILHWHSNGVRCLLRLGPILWSGGDDKAICLWRVADGERLESIEEAHEAGVMSMVIAGRGIWSSGYDGRVKEWSVGGAARECTREVKFDEPLRALCPVGDHIWMCGQSRNIAVYAGNMTQVDSLEGHGSYVSSLILVDRVETRLLWSSSLADRSLRVWRHVLRGGNASEAELVAANKLYEEQQWTADSKIKDADTRAEQARGELAGAQIEFSARYEDALVRAAGAERGREYAEAAKARSQEEAALAKRAEAEARAEAAGLREEVRDALNAQRVAKEDSAAKAAAAAAADAAATQARQERDAAKSVASQRAAELSAEQQRASELREKLDSAMAVVADGVKDAAALREELKHQGTMLADAQALLVEEAQRCTELQARVLELQSQISNLEGERDDSRKEVKALERQYAELDVFKLDIIARELKSVDKQIDRLFDEAKTFLQASKKFTDYGASNASAKMATTVSDTSTRLRGTVRDVIERCLSETQKLHVGAAIQDAKAAGILKDGGGMCFVINEGEELSAGQLRQQDELKRNRRQSQSK